MGRPGYIVRSPLARTGDPQPWGGCDCLRTMWLPFCDPLHDRDCGSRRPTRGRKCEEENSHRNVDHFFMNGWRNRLIPLAQAFHIAFDGLADVGERLCSRRALRDATRKRGNGRNESAVFIPLDDDQKCHEYPCFECDGASMLRHFLPCHA